MDMVTTTAMLRAYLLDIDSENRLLKFKEESSNISLELYINMALSRYNTIMPMVVMHTIDTFPFTASLIHAAAVECLISNGILQARNTLDYNNSGISVKIADGNRYNNQLSMLMQMFQQELDAYKIYKININMEGCYGASPSPYAYLGAR